ncbi:AcvB/VirJ family lysyl-phosphatidylglycerol hydrolase [Oryzibacter oryziterrae]|uniref:AcvB/VirJ family lysyl-phosphatidylglycerol hydrolase n=1 Tax=Oryzibacter oryziterrae TaxID=2766474 RepID=UPI001F35907A|nr:AcvB/VirJ family lysyl-phosphatidylglycerol hydrolase [Oryzibacter oryziterrae]
MKRLLIVAVAVVLLLTGAAALAFFYLFPTYNKEKLDTLAIAEIVTPITAAKGTVVLLSGDAGYTFSDKIKARLLAASGAVVIGLDTPATLAKGGSTKDDCVYFVSDIEQASQDVQRAFDIPHYHSPVIAGSGLGGTFALALAAQTPEATIERTIAVDPLAALPLTKELCSAAEHKKSPDGKGWIYALQTGPLPDPVDVYLTGGRDKDGAAHVDQLIAAGFGIHKIETNMPARTALRTALTEELHRSGDDSSPLSDLPLSPLPVAATHDTMAIILSGDGGWRDIDSQIGTFLSQDGVPVVGVDSLRYFWNTVPPEQAAKDLSRIIDTYQEKWKVSKVALVGYSFGADALPAIYMALPDAEKAKVSLVSLLAYTGARQFEIQISAILGGKTDPNAPSTITDLEKIPGKIVQCVYGTEDSESACPRVKLDGMQAVQHPGGHHFNDDYLPVAKDILARIQ